VSLSRTTSDAVIAASAMIRVSSSVAGQAEESDSDRSNSIGSTLARKACKGAVGWEFVVLDFCLSFSFSVHNSVTTVNFTGQCQILQYCTVQYGTVEIL
jgi:hypothetical protein